MGAGSISLLVDSPLRDLMYALREVTPETRKQVNAATKAAALPIWREETRGRAETRIQQRALAGTSTVSVTSRNVTLVAGGTGKLSSGTPIVAITRAAEFGMNATKPIKSHSKKGKPYTRTAGNAFGPNRRKGYVAFPAAAESIPRFASLWVQTFIRTLHESIEKVS